MSDQIQNTYDAILIGGGVLSATMGTFIKELFPQWNICFFERLPALGKESSDAWNNAGTGHAAYCELNYTKPQPDGSVDCSKAYAITEQFEESKQFWAYLVEQQKLTVPDDFIYHVPHSSFVHGTEDVAFLKKRHETLQKNHLFSDLEYSEDPKILAEWFPLILKGRDAKEPVAGTRMKWGTDVNFGALTRGLFDFLEKLPETDIFVHHEVRDIKQNDRTDLWTVRVKDVETGEKKNFSAAFVFIGAGGYALDLLDKSEIPEAKGYGGFPVSGRWLRCKNEEIIAQHHAKVYGQASVGSPPMSVPHLDTRHINGKKELLFGPFAGFSTKFLKNGSYFDFIGSIDSDNIIPMLEAGYDNIPLTTYLIGQVRMNHEDRMESLRAYYPTARSEDWELKIAGQRVQVIKDDEELGGQLEFGTEVVHSVDGSLAAVLGASPGASTAVSIILSVLEKCFWKELRQEQIAEKLEAMIPSYGKSLMKDELLAKRVRNWSGRVLGLVE